MMMKNKKVLLMMAVMLVISFSAKSMHEGPRVDVQRPTNLAGDGGRVNDTSAQTQLRQEQERLLQQQEAAARLLKSQSVTGGHNSTVITKLATIYEEDEHPGDQNPAVIGQHDVNGGAPDDFTAAQLAALEHHRSRISFTRPEAPVEASKANGLHTLMQEFTDVQKALKKSGLSAIHKDLLEKRMNDITAEIRTIEPETNVVKPVKTVTPQVKKPNKITQWLKKQLTARAVNKVLSDAMVKADLKSISSDLIKQRAIVKQIVGDFRDGVMGPKQIFDGVISSDPDAVNNPANQANYKKLIADVYEVMVTKGLRTALMKKTPELLTLYAETLKAYKDGTSSDASSGDVTVDPKAQARITDNQTNQKKLITEKINAVKAAADKKAEELASDQENFARSLNGQNDLVENLMIEHSNLLQTDSALNTKINDLWKQLTGSAVEVLDAYKDSLNSLDDATDIFADKFKTYGRIKAEIEKLINDAVKKKAEEDAAEKIASQLTASIISTSVRNVVVQAEEQARLKALADAAQEKEEIELAASKKEAEDAAQKQLNEIAERMALRKRALEKTQQGAEALRKVKEKALIKKQEKAEALRLAALAKKATAKLNRKPVVIEDNLGSAFKTTKVSIPFSDNVVAQKFAVLKENAKKALDRAEQSGNEFAGKLKDFLSRLSSSKGPKIVAEDTEVRISYTNAADKKEAAEGFIAVLSENPYVQKLLAGKTPDEVNVINENLELIVTKLQSKESLQSVVKQQVEGLSDTKEIAAYKKVIATMWIGMDQPSMNLLSDRTGQFYYQDLLDAYSMKENLGPLGKQVLEKAFNYLRNGEDSTHDQALGYMSNLAFAVKESTSPAKLYAFVSQYPELFNASKESEFKEKLEPLVDPKKVSSLDDAQKIVWLMIYRNELILDSVFNSIKDQQLVEESGKKFGDLGKLLLKKVFFKIRAQNPTLSRDVIMKELLVDVTQATQKANLYSFAQENKLSLETYESFQKSIETTINSFSSYQKMVWEQLLKSKDGLKEVFDAAEQGQKDAVSATGSKTTGSSVPVKKSKVGTWLKQAGDSLTSAARKAKEKATGALQTASDALNEKFDK